MNSYHKGFSSAKYDSPIKRLRSNWQFQPPYNNDKIEDVQYRRGFLDGKRAIGAPTPGQEYLLEQIRRMPLDSALRAEVEQGVLCTSDRAARESARQMERMFARLPAKLEKLRAALAEDAERNGSIDGLL